MNVVPLRKEDWVKEVLDLVEEGESSFWRAAVIMQRQISDGMSQVKVAKALGKSRSWVQFHLGWLKEKKNTTSDDASGTGTPSRKTPFSGQKQKKRKPRKQPESHSYQPDDLIQEECVDCNSQEERWHNSLANVAGDAVSMEAYWAREFGEWEKFSVPSTHVTLAKQAAEAWTNLASKIAKMGGSRGKT